MALASGVRLGSYEILTLLGAGGMGEVYRARDSRLGRDVAIKVLPEAFARDPERLARFEREARVLASLNHPNIAAIYGLEQSDGVQFLVLELVPGETLRGPLALDEALAMARQVAEALEAAHEKGVVHRDLKPANIKVTPEGKVKVLDFGLAKALAEEAPADAANSPTLTAGTRAGTILGTAAYMSPEQARGRHVDKRSDIWAFGCVLYELLAGKQAFGGESISDSMAAILKGEPDWNALPPETPASVVRLLRLCLRKDSKQRLHDIADGRLELEEALSAPAQPVPAPGVAPVRRRLTSLGVAAALLVVAAYVVGIWRGASRVPAAPQWSGVLLGGSRVAMGPHIAPDGQTLAFLAMVDGLNQVAVMKPASGNWTVLTRDRSRGLVSDICWSGDGTKLYYDRYFDAPRGVFSVPVFGGEERLVLEDAGGPQVLPDGSLLVTRINAERQSQLHRFWPETGRLQALNALVSAATSYAPVRVVPGGAAAVFYGRPLDQIGGLDHIHWLDLASNKNRRLAPSIPALGVTEISFPIAVEGDGRSVLFDLPAGNLHHIIAAPTDGSASLRPVLDLTAAPGYLDIGPDGSLYLDQWTRPGEVLRFAPEGGSVERLGEVVSFPSALPISLPDGRMLVPSRPAGRDRLIVFSPGKDPSPFLDTEEETTSPAVLVGPKEVAFLLGTPPNRTIALASISDGRLLRRLDGSKGAAIDGLAASPDGKTLYYTAAGMVWTIPSTDGAPRKLRSGEGVTVDPYKQDLIIKLNERSGVRLVRMPLSGGPDRPIPVEGDVSLTPTPLPPNMVARDGRIVLQITPRDSWFWPAGLLDPATGRLQKIPLPYEGDMPAPSWTADGKIVTIAYPLRAALWRFRRDDPNRRSTEPRP